MRIILQVCLLFAVVCALQAPAESLRKIPPDKAVLQFKASTGTVTFKHEEHATKRGVACEKCHHTLQAGSTQSPQACSACHKAADGPGMLSLRNAVHKKCWDCHKQEAAKGRKAPQQMPCAGCHVRAKA